MKLIYKISIIALVIIFPALLSCSSDEEEMPTSPIFSDVESIDVEWESPNFEFYLPDEVEYAVLGIFSEQIETSGNTITNEASFLGGSMSGLDGWSRSSVSSDNLYLYNLSSNKFTTDSFSLNTGTTYYWAVWGFDKHMNLTHASGCEHFTF